MAIKNRFFKTTHGVAFEFAACKDSSAPSSNSVAADATTTFTSILGGTNANGDFYLLRQDPTTGITYAARNDGTAAANFRTGTYKDWPHSFAWCVDGANDRYYLTSQFIPAQCEPVEKSAYSAAAAQDLTLASSGIPAGVYQELQVVLLELTPGSIPLPSFDYTVMLSPSVNEAAAWTSIAAQINAANGGEFFTAVAGATSITITVNSGSESRTLKAVAGLYPTKADPVNYGVTFSQTINTAGTVGIGTQAIVQDMYYEACVRQGVGHFYTPDGVLPSEFGIPDTLQTLFGGSNNFTLYRIAGYKNGTVKAPQNVVTNKFYIFIAVITSEVTAFERLFGASLSS